MITCKETPIRLSADFLAEILWARREQMTLSKYCKIKLVTQDSEKLSFRYEGEIKTLSDKQKLKEVINTNTCLTRDLYRSSSSRNKTGKIYKMLDKVINGT